MRTKNHWNAFCACMRAFFAALALLLCITAVGGRAETDGTVRVRLTRLGSPSTLEMRADCDYYLDAESALRISAGSDMIVSADDGGLTLRVGKRSVALGASARLIRGGSGNRGIRFRSPALSNRFCGDLVLSAAGDVITPVLHIYVEDYLYGVVGCEMAPTSGLEALKAQAVVARNYALRQKYARAASAFDLSDSGDALVFRGFNDSAEYADVLRAVDATRGQALYYGDRPATCYFCDSNGGQTESSANVLGEALPYSDVRDDPYDFEGAGARKTATLRKDASGLAPELTDALISGLLDQLEQAGLSTNRGDIEIEAIRDVTAWLPRYDAPSRLFQSLAFQLDVTGVAANGETRALQATVSVPTYGSLERWYDLSINADDNETVWVEETDRAFEITFRRSGSGLGMSRRGAQVMARKGFSCEDILDYYYPGARLRQLELTDAARGDRDPESDAAPTDAEPIATARLGRKIGLYARAEDGGDALATLPAGATVQVYAVQGDWAAVGSGGLYGFVRAEALSTFELAGVEATEAPDGTFARVSAGPADVLQLPVATARALTALLDGDVVRLKAYTDAWARIATSDGAEGFVARSALTLQTEDADDDTAAPEGGEITVVKGGRDLFVSDDRLLLYERWSADSAVLATLHRGDRVRLGAYNAVWACVRADGVEGFALMSGLSETDPDPAEAGIEGGPITRVKEIRYAAVTRADAPLYPSWSEGDAPLALLQKGDRVRLGAYNDAWACVRIEGVTGFMRVEALDLSDSAAQADDSDVQYQQFDAVVTRDAALYAGADLSGEAVVGLARGARVRVYAYDRQSAYVEYAGQRGFVALSFLKKAE